METKTQAGSGLRRTESQKTPRKIGIWELEENIESRVNYVAKVKDYLVYASMNKQAFDSDIIGYFLNGFIDNPKENKGHQYVIGGISVLKTQFKEREKAVKNLVNFVKEFSRKKDVKELIKEVTER